MLDKDCKHNKKKSEVNSIKSPYCCPMMHNSINPMMYGYPMGNELHDIQKCPIMQQQIKMYQYTMPLCYMNTLPIQNYHMPMYTIPVHPNNCTQTPQMDIPMVQMSEMGIKDWYEEYESEDSSEDSDSYSSEDTETINNKRYYSDKSNYFNPYFNCQPQYKVNQYRTEEYYDDEE